MTFKLDIKVGKRVYGLLFFVGFNCDTISHACLFAFQIDLCSFYSTIGIMQFYLQKKHYQLYVHHHAE